MIEGATIIKDEMISSMLDIDGIVEVCKSVFAGLQDQSIHSPKKCCVTLPGNSEKQMRWMNTMPAYLTKDNVVGVKWAGICTDNAEIGLPKINATIVLNNLKTGMPFAILDGSLITHYRTAASVLLAAKIYAPINSQVITLIGPGCQGKYTALFLAKNYDICKINVLARSEKGYEDFKSFIKNNISRNIEIVPVKNLADSFHSSDIILAASSSTSPIITKENFSNIEKKFVCGLSGFYDISIDILDEVETVIFDSIAAKTRIEEACKVDFSKYQIQNISDMVSPLSFQNNCGVNLYLPVGISAMDISLANYFYKKSI